jgi:hypothetical protein
VRLALTAGACLVSISAFGESILEFDRWMEQLDKQNQRLQKSLARADGAEAVASAQILSERYQAMDAFFVARGAADEAVKISREGEALLTTVRSALERDDFAAASVAAVNLGRACRSCHVSYKPLT